MEKINVKRFLKYGFIVAFLCLFVINFNKVISWLNMLLGVLFPLLLGCVMAYILNILLIRLEKIYFPGTKNKFLAGTRRPVCIVLSVAILLMVLLFVSGLVIPQVINCFMILSKNVPGIWNDVVKFLIAKSEMLPAVQEKLKGMNLDWGGLFGKLSSGLMNGTKGFLTSATTIVGSFFGMVTNVIVAIIFSLYVLACKEDVGEKCNRVMKAFLKKHIYEKICYVLGVVNQCFSNFIVGQVTEAVILGSLCALGMTLLRLPYAGSVGALVGLTALIPVFGAYIGAVLGAFMIVTVEPRQALVFLIFLLVLQQIEGNLIYPKVVGSSIGLPGIWVLAAIMIGSGLGGVVGMLVGVPIAAAGYKLLRDATKKKEAQKGIEPDDVHPV